MFKHFVVTACLLAGATQSAHAETGSVSGTGILDIFPGYGYTYVANWESSAGSFSFQTQVSVPPIYFNGTTVSGNFRPISTPTTFSDFDFHATAEFTFIDLTTGLQALPPQLQRQTRISGSTFQNFAVQAGQGEIRFSNAYADTQSTLVDGNGNSLLNGSQVRPGETTRYRFEVSQHFVGGSFLQISPDPSCASLSCMVPGRDMVNVGSVNFSVLATVPEPHTSALLLGGLLSIGTLAGLRRRSKSQSADTSNVIA